MSCVWKNIAYFLFTLTFFLPVGLQGNEDVRRAHESDSVWNSQDPVSTINDRIPHLSRRASAEKLYSIRESAESYSSEPPPTISSQAKVIVDPQEGLLAKVMAIRNAKHTIDFTTFILTNDESGQILLNEIKKAYERGVSIRMMVDSSGSFNMSHKELKALFNATPGYIRDKNGKLTDIPATLEIKTINSLLHMGKFIGDAYHSVMNNFRSPEDQVAVGNRWRNRRSHDKLLLVDADYGPDAIAILGGRNVSNHYYGVPAPDADTYHDMEVIVRPGKDLSEISEFANQIQSHYERLFYHQGNKKLKEKKFFRKRLDKTLKAAEETSNHLLSRYHPVGQKLNAMIKDDYLNSGFEDTEGYFVNQIENLTRRNAFINPDSFSNPKNRENGASLSKAFVEMVRSAENSIDIVSPYLYLYPEEMERLRKWLRADPHRRLRIVTNSLYSADNVAAQALTDLEVGPRFTTYFSEFGDRAQLLTYGKEDANDLGGNADYGKVHSKFAVIDGKRSFVTSSNGDPRSRYLNSELGYVIEGQKTAEELTEEVETLVKGSYEFGTPEWRGLRNHPNLKWKMRTQKMAYPVIQKLKLRGTI